MTQEFYKFDAKISYGRSSVTIEADTEFDTLAHIDKSSELLKKNSFRVIKGKKWLDILPFNNSTHFAISDRFKQIIDDNNLTGLKTFPISIQGHTEKCYNALIITSIAGAIQNLEQLNNYEEENIRFDLDTWDGSDFFTLKDTLIFACTKQVAELLKKHKLTNLEIEEL